MHDATYNQELRTLTGLRVLAVVGEALVIGGLELAFDVFLPVADLVFVVVAQLMACALAEGFGRRPVRASLLAGFMAFDVLALAGALYLTGGPRNPFAMLFVAQLALAASMLPRRYVLGLVGLAAGSFALLFADHVPLGALLEANHGPEVCGANGELCGPHQTALDAPPPSLSVWGFWVALATSGLFVALIVSRQSALARERAAALAVAREQAATQRNLAALGTTAAGALHELASPLAAISVAAGEVARELGPDDELAPELDVIRGEVTTSQTILREFLACFDAAGEALVPLDLPRQLGETVDALRAAHPDATIELAVSSALAVSETAIVGVPLALAQVVRELVRNAIRSVESEAAATVRLVADLDPSESVWMLTVSDDGPGLPDAVRQRAGRRPGESSRPEGLGLGLYLARLVALQLGGNLDIGDGGDATAIRLTFPLDPVQATS